MRDSYFPSLLGSADSSSNLHPDIDDFRRSRPVVDRVRTSSQPAFAQQSHHGGVICTSGIDCQPLIMPASSEQLLEVCEGEPSLLDDSRSPPRFASG